MLPDPGVTVLCGIIGIVGFEPTFGFLFETGACKVWVLWDVRVAKCIPRQKIKMKISIASVNESMFSFRWHGNIYGILYYIQS